MKSEEIRYSLAVTHAHSWESDGMVSPQRVIESASQHGISVVALTDHDTMDGIHEARLAGARYGIETVTGIEVTTFNPHHLGGPLNQKHVIGLFPSTNLIHVIPDSKPINWVIESIHDQGGFVVIPHPGGTTASFGIDEIRHLAEKYKIDGIETINGHHDRNSHLKELISEFGLAEIGASDSHFGSKDIAAAYTRFPGKSAEDFFRALKEGTTQAIPGKRSQISKRDIVLQHGRAWIILGGRRYILRNLRRVKTIPRQK